VRYELSYGILKKFSQRDPSVILYGHQNPRACVRSVGGNINSGMNTISAGTRRPSAGAKYQGDGATSSTQLMPAASRCRAWARLSGSGPPSTLAAPVSLSTPNRAARPSHTGCDPLGGRLPVTTRLPSWRSAWDSRFKPKSAVDPGVGGTRKRTFGIGEIRNSLYRNGR